MSFAHTLLLINQTIHECARLGQARIARSTGPTLVEERMIGKAVTHCGALSAFDPKRTSLSWLGTLMFIASESLHR